MEEGKIRLYSLDSQIMCIGFVVGTFAPPINQLRHGRTMVMCRSVRHP